MIDSFARLFPTWYRLPPRERGYQQHVIVNWLEIEIEPDAPRRMPTLNELRSWRNRENIARAGGQFPLFLNRARGRWQRRITLQPP